MTISIESPKSLAITSAGAPLFTTEMSVGEGIAEALDDAGIELVMGIVAGHMTPVFEALYDHPNIRTIQTRQEITAALAANAYGRLTNKPAVIMGEGEFILGTGTQGIIESLLGSTPMVIVTEMFDGGRMSHHGNYHSGSGEQGSYDAVAAFKAISKKVLVSYYPAQAIQQVQLAVKHAMSGEPGPVTVICHSGSFEGTVGPKTFPQIYRSSGYIKARPRSVDPEALTAAVQLLEASERPVIIAGNGVRLAQAYESLAKLSTVLGAPVVTTQGGKGVFDETAPLAGGTFGEWGREAANALVADADLILAVGTKLGPLDTVDQIPSLIDPARQAMIQIDTDPMNAAWTFPVEVVLVGDADFVLGQLADQCEGVGIEREASGVTRVAQAVAEHPQHPVPAATDGLLRPEEVIATIQAHWPADGVITTDAGESRVYMLNCFLSHGGGSYLVPHGGGGMGYAISGAFGAKLARPDRAVLGVLGDGGFAMTMNALMNALQEDVPITIVIFNNRALGWPLHVMADDKKKYFEFHDFDHAAIAEAMGCSGVRVETVEALGAALDQAQVSRVPFVIDAQITIQADFLAPTADIAKGPRERPWRGKAE